MMYARVNGTNILEICTPLAGFNVEQCYHPDIVAQLIPCSDGVTPEWTYVDGVFVAPVVEETVVEEPVVEETPPVE